MSPENGYLSSVSSGSDFKFKLTGAGMSLVDQVFANGVPFVAAGSANAGNCTVSGGVYTISNITEDKEPMAAMRKPKLEPHCSLFFSISPLLLKISVVHKRPGG